MCDGICDSMHFLAPAKRGDILIFKGAVNKVWRSSMEIGLKVVTQHLTTGELTHILSAYFTFVAVMSWDSRRNCSDLPETPLEKRRFKEAELRRQRRKKEKEQRLKRRAKDEDLNFLRDECQKEREFEPALVFHRGIFSDAFLIRAPFFHVIDGKTCLLEQVAYCDRGMMEGQGVFGLCSWLGLVWMGILRGDIYGRCAGIAIFSPRSMPQLDWRGMRKQGWFITRMKIEPGLRWAWAVRKRVRGMGEILDCENAGRMGEVLDREARGDGRDHGESIGVLWWVALGGLDQGFGSVDTEVFDAFGQMAR